MAITFNEATKGSILDRLGEALVIFDTARTAFRDGGTWDTDLNEFLETLVGDGVSPSGDIQIEKDIADGLATALEVLRDQVNAYLRKVYASVRMLPVRHLWRDAGQGDPMGLVTPSPTAGIERSDYKRALQVIRRQFAAASKTVKTCAVALTSAAGAGNVGNGVVVTSTKRGDGLTQELMPAMVGEMRCILAGNQEVNSANNELFEFTARGDRPPWHVDWMESNRGLNITKRLRVVDPTSGRSRGNYINVNSFEDFTSDNPDGWTVSGGTVTTHYRKSTAEKYFGSNSLELRATLRLG